MVQPLRLYMATGTTTALIIGTFVGKMMSLLFNTLSRSVMGFPGGFPGGKESTCQCRRCRFDPWVGKIPLWRKWQPTSVFLLGKTHGQRSLLDYSPWSWKGVGYDLATKRQQQTTRFIMTFLPRSKRLLISWLQSPSAVILELKKIKSVTASTFSPFIFHEVMGLDATILVFWTLSFKQTFWLSFFTLIKMLFSSSSLSAFRVGSVDLNTFQ